MVRELLNGDASRRRELPNRLDGLPHGRLDGGTDRVGHQVGDEFPHGQVVIWGRDDPTVLVDLPVKLMQNRMVG